MTTEPPKPPSRFGRIAGVLLSGMLGFGVGAGIGFGLTLQLIPAAVAAGADPFLDESFGYSFFLLLCPAILIFGALFGWLGSRLRRSGPQGCMALLVPGLTGLVGGLVLSLALYLLVAYTG
jgi:hypothetical protein